MTDLKIITMRDIEAEPVEFLWRPYIPFGKITILQGDPGDGKTTLALAIAAAVTNGEALPGGCAAAIAAVCRCKTACHCKAACHREATVRHEATVRREATCRCETQIEI